MRAPGTLHNPSHTNMVLKISPNAAFTRPADTTAYASGDLVANSTTPGSVVPLQISLAAKSSGQAYIRRVRLKKSGTSVTNASFRVHLYTAAPTVTNGDNGAWLSTESGYIGAFDVTVDKAFSNAAVGQGAPLVGTSVLFKGASSKNVWALIEARGAYTPASAEVFTLSLEAEQE